jgi:hypothetical protein
MQPGRFTELFFLDEATAFAAGHRPCALCRREDYRHFLAIWDTLHPGERTANAVDARLHRERLVPETRAHRRHRASLSGLPDGTFVLDRGEPYLVREDALLRWTPGGYAELRSRRGDGDAAVVTPPSLVAVLRAGWHPVVPLLHPSATGDDA